MTDAEDGRDDVLAPEEEPTTNVSPNKASAFPNPSLVVGLGGLM